MIRTITFILILFVVSGCSSENRVKHNGDIRGIDVSHFQGAINWGQVKKDQLVFAMAKASEGITYVDPRFDMNWEEIKSAGLVRGAYHFYVAQDDPLKQAENFLSLIKRLGENDLPPVLDVERGGYPVNNSMSDREYQDNLLKWLNRVEKVSGKRPIIYTGFEFANQHLKRKEFSRYRLWIAEYDVVKPRVPDTWQKTGYSFWQKTSSDQLHGVKGKIDYDVFNGSHDEFIRLIK